MAPNTGLVSFSRPLTVSSLPQILIYHPAFIKYVFDSWLQGHGRYPSTGILSVIFSLHICDEVGPPPPCLPAPPQGVGDRGLLILCSQEGRRERLQSGRPPSPSRPRHSLSFLEALILSLQ